MHLVTFCEENILISQFTGEYARQQDFSKNLDELQKRRGPFFSKFLKEQVKCTEDQAAAMQYIETKGASNLPNCNTLARYEGSTYRVYKFKLLDYISSEYKPLSTYIRDYYEKLKENHNSYFLVEKPILQLFDILSVAKWPRRMPSTEPNQIRQLADSLQATNELAIGSDWPKFREQVVEHLCENKDLLKKNPEDFWTYILNSKHFEIPKSIQDLIGKKKSILY